MFERMRIRTGPIKWDPTVGTGEYWWLQEYIEEGVVVATVYMATKGGPF